MALPRVPKWIGWPLLGLWAYIVLAFFGRQAVFHPSRYPEGLWNMKDQWGAEDVWLDASDGVRIHGWMIPSRQPSPHVTLYLHGNAGNLTHRVDHIQALREVGTALLIIDYRGYGKSEGKPTEQGCYRDTDAAYEHLLAEGYSAERIILYGESLGTAMATDLASRRPCGGVILEAPFPSAKAVAATVLPLLGPLVVSGLDTAKKIGLVEAPVLIIHGTSDQVIDYKLGRQVFEAATEPKQFWTVEGAQHSDIVYTAGPDYIARLRRFYGEGL
jgi:fermentation-respiration switch protein FrsA (DUF1100 family)